MAMNPAGSGASQQSEAQLPSYLASMQAVKNKYTAAAPLEKALQQSLASSSENLGSARESRFGNKNGENVSETA